MKIITTYFWFATYINIKCIIVNAQKCWKDGRKWSHIKVTLLYFPEAMNKFEIRLRATTMKRNTKRN